MFELEVTVAPRRTCPSLRHLLITAPHLADAFLDVAIQSPCDLRNNCFRVFGIGEVAPELPEIAFTYDPFEVLSVHVGLVPYRDGRRA